jgi:hypothetical protein
LDRFKFVLTALRVVPQPAPSAGGTAGGPVPGRALLPAKDQVILAAALGCRASHLLTGDVRHFRPLIGRPDLAAELIVQTVSDFLVDQAGREDRKA